MRFLGLVIVKNFWDVVYNVDLFNWKEIMVIFCIFFDLIEFLDFCEVFGDCIQEFGECKDVLFCYLVGFKLEKVVFIWVVELEEVEVVGMKEFFEDFIFFVYVCFFQSFIEKVIVFCYVIQYCDVE